MTDALTGDTIDLSDADFTIFTYMDSTGCTSCKMKLAIWKEFLSAIDTITDSNVKSIMVVHPKDYRDVMYLLKRDSYTYPVFIDKRDSVNTVNEFPDDPVFQSFLLDKSHRILAIGNPVNLSGVASLYRSLLSGEKTLSASGTEMVKVDRNIIHLGSVQLGKTVTADIVLTNVGNDTVHIKKIMPSCDCTTADIPLSSIPPRTNVKATIKFKEDSLKGDFNRSVHIYYEGFDYPSVIQLCGTLK